MQVKSSICHGEEALKMLSLEGIQYNAYAAQCILDPLYPFEPNAPSIEVISIALVDLGLPKGGTYRQVEKASLLHNLIPIPLTYVQSLAMQWPGTAVQPASPKGEHPVGAHVIFSYLLHDKDDFPKGFYLITREDGKWLRGYISSEDYVFPSDAVFIFQKGPCIPTL
jgi:hypothetical protein